MSRQPWRSLLLFGALQALDIAAMLRQCRPEHEGANFTLQASAQLLLGELFGALSGVLAKALGYSGLLLSAGLLELLVLVAVPLP